MGLNKLKEKTATSVFGSVKFLKKLPFEWKITAIRSSIFRFLYQMVFPYLSIFALALGATGTQLGIINSVGMGVAGLIGPFTGWLIDKYDNKSVYLFGIALLALSWLIYGIAQNWPIIIIAMLAYWVGYQVSFHSCGVVCGNSLYPEDRVTAMSLCETIAPGLLGIAGPMFGAFLVAAFGGLNTEGIRPLFFISLIGTIASFLLILRYLKRRKYGDYSKSQIGSPFTTFKILLQNPNLMKFNIISIVSFLPMGMILPFTQPFANEVKGADEFVLGAMVTGFAIIPLVFGIPSGKLADRIGRKKLLYLIAPLFWASNLFLIWAPNSTFLIVAGMLQGFLYINLVITGAIQFELVGPEFMGRWLGIILFFRMSVAAATSFLAGLIWDKIGPQYIFLIYVGLDIFIRIPLLITLPETLRTRRLPDSPTS